MLIDYFFKDYALLCAFVHIDIESCCYSEDEIILSRWFFRDGDEVGKWLGYYFYYYSSYNRRIIGLIEVFRDFSFLLKVLEGFRLLYSCWGDGGEDIFMDKEWG